MAGVGAYPGTFNPLTVAHLGVAKAFRDEAALTRVNLIVSTVPLAKEDLASPPLPERLERLARTVAEIPWMEVSVTHHQLIADVAAGYDAMVVGADKWAQMMDQAWYGSPHARDTALAGLPPVYVAPRPPFPLPSPDPPRIRVLVVDPAYAEVSSSAVRAGRLDWLAPGAGG